MRSMAGALQCAINPCPKHEMQGLPSQIALWQCRVSVGAPPKRAADDPWTADATVRCTVLAQVSTCQGRVASRALQMALKLTAQGQAQALRARQCKSTPLGQTNTLNFSDADDAPNFFFLLVQR